MTDRARIRQLMHAIERLMQAREQERQALRMVKEAEAELQAITDAVTQPQPSGDGEGMAA